MPIDTSIQRLPWVPPPRESSLSTVAPQLFAQGLERGQRQQMFAAEEEERQQRAALASRRFAAQKAYQDDVERDIAEFTQQNKRPPDYTETAKISARRFLTYGPIIGEGVGSLAGNILSQQRTPASLSYREMIGDIQKYRDLGQNDIADALQAKLQKEQTQQQQGGIRLTQADQRLLQQKRYQDFSMSARERGMDQRDIDLAIRADQSGYAVPQTQTGENQGQVASSVPLGLPGNPFPAGGTAAVPVTTNPPPAQQPLLTRVERPPTTAVVTGAQKDVLAANSAIASIDQAVATLQRTPEAAGVRGIVGETVEGVGGQLGLKTGTRVTEARTQLRETAHQLVNALRVETGQMSNWERQMLEDVGSPLSWKTDDQAAISKLNVLRRLIGLRELRLSHRLNRPPQALETLSDKDLVQAKKSGYLTPEAARAEYQRRGRK